MTVMRSPNEMMAAASEHMLDGNKPDGSREDAMKVLNFIAFNVVPDLAVVTCKLMTRIYPEVFDKLSDGDIEAIVAYQIAQKQ